MRAKRRILARSNYIKGDRVSEFEIEELARNRRKGTMTRYRLRSRKWPSAQALRKRRSRRVWRRRGDRPLTPIRAGALVSNGCLSGYQKCTKLFDNLAGLLDATTDMLYTWAEPISNLFK